MSCQRRFRRGWVCTRCPVHDGPCALVPAWWNLPGWLWVWSR